MVPLKLYIYIYCFVIPTKFMHFTVAMFLLSFVLAWYQPLWISWRQPVAAGAFAAPPCILDLLLDIPQILLENAPLQLPTLLARISGHQSGLQNHLRRNVCWIGSPGARIQFWGRSQYASIGGRRFHGDP